MNHKFLNENLALPLLASNSSASSSSPSSSSSFCSPNITNPAYNGFNLIPNEFYLNQHNFAILNPFVAPSQMNQTPSYQQLFENNLSIFDQLALYEKQKLDSLKLANEMCPSTNSANNSNNGSKSSSSSNDMSNKLNIINHLAKQIDSLNEATTKEDKKEKKKDKLSKKKNKESSEECCSASCSDLACCKCLIEKILGFFFSSYLMKHFL